MSKKSDNSADDTALTRTSAAELQRLDANLEATESALARGEGQYVRFFREHEKFFRWVISRYYPLGPDLLAEYSDEWDWQQVSCNENIDWSAKLTRQFEDKLYWGAGGLSGNESLPWSKSFISEHKQKWAWGILSENESIPWDNGLIFDYFDNWAWDGVFSIWSNGGIKWTRPLLEEVIANRNEREETRMVPGKSLARNDSMDWTPALAEWLFRKVEVFMHPPGKVLGLLSSSDKLGFDLELFTRLYASRRDWSIRRARQEVEMDTDLWKTLSYNPDLNWTRDLIETHEQRWFWRQLSLNPGLPWTVDLLEAYRNRWDWGWHGLSRNPALPWSEELIERYSKRWNWFWLSRNPGLPWSKSFIEKNEDRLNWNGLSENEGLPWSEDLIATYEDRWDWQGGRDGGTKLDEAGAVDTTAEGEERRRTTEGFSNNKGLPWSISLLEQYFERGRNMNADTVRVVWSLGFEPYVDDGIIERTFRRVT